MRHNIYVFALQCVCNPRDFVGHPGTVQADIAGCRFVPPAVVADEYVTAIGGHRHKMENAVVIAEDYLLVILEFNS